MLSCVVQQHQKTEEILRSQNRPQRARMHSGQLLSCFWQVGRWRPGGSPPRLRSEHQWACGYSVVNQKHQYFCHLQTAYGHLQNEARHCRAPGKNLLHHKVDNYLTALKVYCSLYQRGCCHPPRICATSHLTDLSVMLNDVTGSITSIRPCPDSFMPVTCARCGSAPICEENRVPLTDLQIQVFFRKCQLSCTVLACEQQRTLGLRGLWFWQFSQKHAHHQLMSLLEMIFFYGSGSAPLGPSLTDPVPAATGKGDTRRLTVAWSPTLSVVTLQSTLCTANVQVESIYSSLPFI